MDQLIAKDAILSTIYKYCQAQDELDRDLFMSLFIPDKTVSFDMSSHLGAPPMDLTPGQFFDLVYEYLSGFTATQHLMGNPRIDVDGEKAHAQLTITAYHCIGTDNELESGTERGYEESDLELHEGKWMIRRIVIRRSAPLDNGKLYDTARQRLEKGEGRKEK